MNKINLHPDFKKHKILYSIWIFLEFIILFSIGFVFVAIHTVLVKITDLIYYSSFYDFGRLKYWKKIFSNIYYYKDKNTEVGYIDFDCEDIEL